MLLLKKKSRICLIFVLSLVFLDSPKLKSQCSSQVFHTSGIQNINGTQVNVTPYGYADTTTSYCPESTQPYLIGFGSSGGPGVGSYTFEFSPPASKIQLNVSGINCLPDHKEIVKLFVNGSHYEIPSPGDQNDCDAFAVLNSNGNIEGNSLGGTSGWKNIIIDGPVNEIVVLDSIVAGLPGGVVFSLLLTENSYGLHEVTACDSITWIDGNTYNSTTETPFYNIVGGSVNGCDSIVSLDLSINSNSGNDVQYGCNSYTWIDGVTYFESNNSSTYILTNSEGCDSIVSLDLTISNINNSVSLSGDLLSSLQENANYQWVDCDNNFLPIYGETEQSFSVTSSGNYAVIVSQDACVDTSNCEFVNLTSIMDQGIGNSLQYYPNPTNGMFFIDLRDNFSQINITLKNILGQVMFRNKYESKQFLEVFINGEKGIYFVEICNDNEKVVLKVVKE